MGIRCFWCEETDRVQRYLRRYHADCSAPWRWLNGMVEFDQAVRPPRTYHDATDRPHDLVPRDDPRWPRQCDCGRVFQGLDSWQVFTERIYRRADTGAELVLRPAPEGAMWDAWWSPDCYKGADGRSLMVMCPGGHEWMIDSKASNCTMKDDWTHRCWVRHGEPPNITVDKNGITCAAGAGSILTANWHGFLRAGELVE